MKIRKTAKGYITIEAACIVSWTVLVMVLVIYLAFYSYDKCVIFQDAYAVCFRGSIQKEESQIVPYIHTHIQSQFGRKYFGVGEVMGSADREGRAVCVTGECQVRVPVYSVFTKAGEDGWQIRTQAKAQIINPSRQIRKWRMLQNVGGAYGSKVL